MACIRFVLPPDDGKSTSCYRLFGRSSMGFSGGGLPTSLLSDPSRLDGVALRMFRPGRRALCIRRQARPRGRAACSAASKTERISRAPRNLVRESLRRACRWDTESSNSVESGCRQRDRSRPWDRGKNVRRYSGTPVSRRQTVPVVWKDATSRLTVRDAFGHVRQATSSTRPCSTMRAYSTQY